MITGKNIILTGANSGIGLKILKLLIQNNNRVFCADTNTDELELLKNNNITIFRKDISSKSAVDEMFDEAVNRLGKIDIFFANAGFGYYEEMDYVSWDRISRIFETNVFSPIYSYQKYREYLRGENGIFVLTCSVIGLIANPGYALYSSTKFALSGFQRAIKEELPDNIQLSCIYPVATDTQFFRRANKLPYKKPFPLQSPETVAKRAIRGIEKGKSVINTSILFIIMKPILKAFPPVKNLFLFPEKRKFTAFRRRINQFKSKNRKS